MILKTSSHEAGIQIFETWLKTCCWSHAEIYLILNTLN